MNLIISGAVGETLRNTLIAIAKPEAVVPIHARAFRMEDVDASSESRFSVATVSESALIDHAYIDPGAKLTDYRLLAFDMDSTLITIECIDEMADFVGKKHEVASITEATMRGEVLDFAESLRRRVALLAGMEEDVMRRVFDERLQLSPGAKSVILSAKSAGLKVLLVSGGFDYFADRLKADLHLDFAFANALEVRDAHLTGRILGSIIDARQKAQLLMETAEHIKCNPSEAIVIGDGANDIQMMNAVKLSVAYKAKPAVRNAAAHSIRFGPLDTLIDWLPAR